MKYNGEDKFAEESSQFIKELCIVERTDLKENYIEINIKTKAEQQSVASIEGFLYDYSVGTVYGNKNDAFHIKSLATNTTYLKKGIATYLMKEVIRYAEYKKVQHITTNPCATICVIEQEALEAFYRKFLFNYKHILFHRKGEIEFRIVSD